MFNVLDTLAKLATESGFAGFFAAGGWQNLVMIVIACVLLYLGIVKGFEPLLLVGIAFGCLLANVSYFPGLDAVNADLNATNALYHPELWADFLDKNSQFYHSYGHILSNAGLLDIFYIGVKAGLYPSLIFMGVGAMTDFGPLIADPKSLLLGAAAQLGVFVAFFGAICLNFSNNNLIVAGAPSYAKTEDGWNDYLASKAFLPRFSGWTPVYAYPLATSQYCDEMFYPNWRDPNFCPQWWPDNDPYYPSYVQQGVTISKNELDGLRFSSYDSASDTTVGTFDFGSSRAETEH